MGLMVASFVLLILVLMIFTDAGVSPMPAKQDPSAQPGEKRADGVLLYRAPARRDAGADAAAPR